MCGIFGAVVATAEKQVLQGLKRLEYRGYDSWGIAGVNVRVGNEPPAKVTAQKSIYLEKHVGKIGQVQELELPSLEVALGHTRWATHGGVTEQNAHPHLSSDGSFALAQNGVVENMQELKEQLVQAGYVFHTQTDTEVLVKLIEHTLSVGNHPLTYRTFTEALRSVRGRNSVAILTHTGEIMAVRYGSPLVVATDPSTQTFFISSDVPSVASVASRYYSLDNGEGVVVRTKSIQLYGAGGEEMSMRWQNMAEGHHQAELGEFTHYMQKEIAQQPQAWLQMGEQFSQDFKKIAPSIQKAQQVFTLGIGSAGFAAAQIAFYLRESGVLAQSILANEAESYRLVIAPGDVVIVVSQSGETADSLEVVEWMKEKGVKIISLVNVPDSSLAQLADYACALNAGPEIGVASTKAFSAQLGWGKMLSLALSGQEVVNVLHELEEYAQEVETWLQRLAEQQTLEPVLQTLTPIKEIFIIGRGQLLMPAFEAALKLKEIAYIHAEGMSGGELKHGTLALIEPGTIVLALVAEDSETAAQYNAISEIKARGGKVLGVAPQPSELFDQYLQIPSHPQFVALSAVLPAQLLAYQLALVKGYDPDKPRNLAKSVTVK